MTSNPSSRSDDDQMNHEIMVDQPLSTSACGDNSALSIDSFDNNCHADQEYLFERRMNSSGCTKWVDFQSYYSLPATPTASENDEHPNVPVENAFTTPSNGRRRRGRCRPATAASITRSYGNTDEENETRGRGGGDLVVITRAKGGRKPISMDLDEVKACRDLGFELEHDPRFFNTIPNFSATSNPGDVKARLKIWAQAVALASSTSRLGC
ncbi:unnamed protein product [Fraxinus pennsylvanica]|uniref:Uncharacterized protein n=1 Tax=Fraxinus pennsylvanica TaxID=56036 RepID=A0AAD1ZZS4_9LAMI|nr:unnamed protein product [Fraxinus pennsylvanica]